MRVYDNTADAFASELELSDTNSNVRDVRVKCSPVDVKCVLVSLSADGTLNAWVCTTSTCATASHWTDNHQADFADIWSTEPITTDRPFDIAYEDTSGDLVIVYDKVSAVSGEELFYRVMTSAGTTFGSETAINTQTSDTASDIDYPYVKCASDDGSDKIGCAMLDLTNTESNAMIWSGSAWGDNALITASAVLTAREQVAVAWETNSGHLLTASAAGANVAAREYTTSWQSAANIGGVATGVGTVHWLMMKSTPRSAGNEIFLGFSGSSNDFATIQWSGTAWGTGTEHEISTDTQATRVFDIALSPDADGDSANVDALVIWGGTTAQIDYRSWSASNTYGAISNFANTGTHAWFNCPEVANPTSADDIDSICAVVDSQFDITRIEWTGGANAPTDPTENDITADTVVFTWEATDVDWIYQAAQLIERGISQGVTAGNTVADIESFFRTSSQGVTVGNTVADLETFFRTSSQGITVANTVARIPIYVRAIAQGVTAGNAVADLESFFRNIPQSVTVGNAVADVETFFRAIAQGVTVGNAVAGAKILLRGISQSIGVADSVASLESYFRNIAQGVTVGNAVDPVVSFFRSISQGVTIGNTVNGVLIIIRNISQSVGVANTVTGVFIAVRNISQGITVGNAATLLGTYARSISQGVGIANTVASAESFFRNIAQGVNIGNTVSSAEIFIRALAQSVTITDNIARSQIFVREIADGLMLTIDAIGEFFNSPASSAVVGVEDDCLIFLGRRTLLCL